MPIHVGALPFAAKSVHEFSRGGYGQATSITATPTGGNHLPDLTAFVPFRRRPHGVLVDQPLAHQSDIGGATHGAYNASATEIFQGIRIPPLMLRKGGGARTSTR